MDPETKKVVISCDVVFDEVPSHQVDNEDSRTSDLASLFGDVAISESGSNIIPSRENIQQDETIGTAIRRSSRQRNQPDYLADYEVQLNNCSFLSCFLIGYSCGN
ncbi:Uncharacterized protein Adt_42053 [Abeliophyllum distichum]|uniref:Uncharacterized protein n=1 Tax=Abeliophyllum distichum TaxID=126358 RepID=A0ABD1PQM0_9LAMI